VAHGSALNIVEENSHSVEVSWERVAHGSALSIVEGPSGYFRQETSVETSFASVERQGQVRVPVRWKQGSDISNSFHFAP
jgi:hypothetical protein